MPAVGYSIASVVTVGIAGSVDNLIANLPGVKLVRRSLVQIFLTRQLVLGLVSATIGGTLVYPSAPVNINTVIGSLPSTEDDLLIEAVGGPGDEIIIAATNTNAATNEIRALVKVMPI